MTIISKTLHQQYIFVYRHISAKEECRDDFWGSKEVKEIKKKLKWLFVKDLHTSSTAE